eukprot:Pgem_evm1s4742
MNSRLGQIVCQENGNLLMATEKQIFIPPTYDKYISWDFADGSLRTISTTAEIISRKMLFGYENLHLGAISCVNVTSDGRTMVTSGEDT